MTSEAEHGRAPQTSEPLAKAPTGIQGFDDVAGGGLPRGRATLVCGGPGSGKTLFGMEFLVRGAATYDEPGLFVAFEESPAELITNVVSFGMDVPGLVAGGKLAVEHIRVAPGELRQTGGYDLEGLFIRLDHLVRSVGARRIVLDTLDTLFSGFSDLAILRGELNRLFRWLKDRGLTVVITGERGAGEQLTRHGLEEYVSDCVIVLEQRVFERNMTRHLRILKYRGSSHGGNEYPFLIYEKGISVVPLSSVRLDHQVSSERVSLGVGRLDALLGGAGVFRGSSVLVTGSAGTGKSSIAALAAEASCKRGERCLYFAFEESPSQIERNMRSIGIDLRPWVEKGLLRFSASRPTIYGLEMHLIAMHQQVEAFAPKLVVVDPISNLSAVGSPYDVRAMLMRLVDYLKSRQTTVIFLSLTPRDQPAEHQALHVSSLMDTWLLLEFTSASGERTRSIHVVKSRGTAHSNQLREFILSDRGVELCDVYVGPAGVLTGTARRTQERLEEREAEARARRAACLEQEIERRRAHVQSKIEELTADLTADEARLRDEIAQEKLAAEGVLRDRREMAHMRRADTPVKAPPEPEAQGEG